MSDRVRYTCVVSNAAGSVQCTASLLLTEPKEDYRALLRKSPIPSPPSAINSDRVAKFCQSVISPTQEMIARANHIEKDGLKTPAKWSAPEKQSTQLGDRSPAYAKVNSPHCIYHKETTSNKISALKNKFQQDDRASSSKSNTPVYNNSTKTTSPRTPLKKSMDTLEIPSRSRSCEQDNSLISNVLNSRSKSCERSLENSVSATTKNSNKLKLSKVQLMQNKFGGKVPNHNKADLHPISGSKKQDPMYNGEIKTNKMFGEKVKRGVSPNRFATKENDSWIANVQSPRKTMTVPDAHTAVCLPVSTPIHKIGVVNENITVDNNKETDFREIIRNKSYERLQKRGSIDSGVSDMSDRDIKLDYRSILSTSTPRCSDVLPQTDRVEHRELLHRQSEPFIRPRCENNDLQNISDICPTRRAVSLEPKILTNQKLNTTASLERCVVDKQPTKKIESESAPIILHTEPSSISVPVGETVIITARFAGKPVPDVKWLKHQRDVRPTDRLSIITSDVDSVLTIRRIHPSDGGIYALVLENKLGVDNKTASVINVEEPPSAPVGKTYATSVGTTELVLSWSGPAYDGGSPITGYRIECCEHNQTKWRMMSTSCKNTTYHAKNLTPNSAFKFRVSCENKSGISEPGEESGVIFLTSSNVRPTMLDSDSEEEELPFEPRSVGITKDKKFEDNYEVLEELGRGKFGSVFRCKDKTTSQIWAAKVLKCREKEKPGIRQEVEIMNCLAHPKVLMLWAAYEASRSIVLVMEYIGGGELFERVSNNSYELTESDCTNYMRQICEAACYIHHRNIIHLDLKPENIVCVSPDNNKIKIIDFGLAKRYKKGETARAMEGTPEFIAPEVVNYDEICYQTDMWSVGVICYVLLSGLSPFMGDNDQETLSNVTRAEFDFDDEAFDEISENAKEFICQLLLKNKSKRLNSQEVLRHHWLAHVCSRLHDKRLNTEKLRSFLARRKWQVPEKNHEDSSDVPDINDNSLKNFNFKLSAENLMHKCSSYDSGIFSDHSHNVSTDSIISESHRSVPKPIVFLKEMRDSEAFAGDAIRFDIKLSGEPDKISWLFEGEAVLEDDRHYIDSNEEGHCSLIIRNVKDDDEGEYTCSASNSCGEITCSADLIICGWV